MDILKVKVGNDWVGIPSVRGEKGDKGDKGNTGAKGDSGEYKTETVSGSTPSITGVKNTQYVCGTVSTLSITPPDSGCIDVIFTSGSTATVLTVPNTVKFPSWFDPTSLEASTTYEINILNGTLGAVMKWT